MAGLRGCAIYGINIAAANRIDLERQSPDWPPHGADALVDRPPGTRIDGLHFFGTSFIADPFCQILQKASPDKEEILLATIDPQLQEQIRQNWPFLRDRRIDAYAGLTSRFGK
jgi:N-carbamoylputrescine amidase